MPNHRAIEYRNRLIGLLLLPVAFFVLVSLATYSANDYPNSNLGPDEVLNAGGRAGAILAAVLFVVCGYGAYAVPLVLAVWSWNRIKNGPAVQILVVSLAAAGGVLAGTTVVHLLEDVPASSRFKLGGAIGLRLAQLATEAFGGGALLVGAAAFLLSVLTPVVWHARRRASQRAFITASLDHSNDPSSETVHTGDTRPVRLDAGD